MLRIGFKAHEMYFLTLNKRKLRKVQIGPNAE
jgi:hypothetical protein